MTAKFEKKSRKSPIKAKLPQADALVTWLPPAVLIIATLAVFWPVCGCEFVTWDDYPNIAKNPLLNPVTFDNVLYFWSHPYLAVYIPLTYSVWAVLAVIAGVNVGEEGISLNPYVFHTANLIVHIATVLVVYQLLKLLSGRRWPAAAGALLFALHPVQVESVAWVTGMKDVLCGLLSVMALWQYALFAGADAQTLGTGGFEGARRKFVHYTIATVALVLAMLAKPSAMTVPLMAVMIDRLFFKRSWVRIGMAIAPWAILSVGCAVVAKYSQPVAEISDAGPLWARPLLAGEALAFYLFKIVWPMKLAVQYRHSPEVVLAGKWIEFAWLVPTALILVSVWWMKRWPWLLASVGIVVVATLPVLGLVPFKFEHYSLVADRYLYVAMLGAALAACFILARVPKPRIAKIVAGVLLAFLAAASFVQTSYWQNTVTLYLHTLEVNPRSEVAYAGLADRAVRQAERTDPAQRSEAYALAEQWASKSIECQPKQEDAYITLGTVLHRENHRDESIAMFRKSLAMEPDNAMALNDLATVLAEPSPKGPPTPDQLREATELCKKSLELEPHSAEAHSNMALFLARQNRMSEALHEAELSVQMDPTSAARQTNLAFFLATTGQRAAALEHVDAALKLDASFLPAQRLRADLARAPQ
jgi:tetratricopeptide (TPR) repeat protein